MKADRGLPESGTDARQLLGEAAELLFRHSLFNGHPRFFGYITSSPAPIGALGDLLASAVNQNVGAWRLAPAATEIEAQTVRWIAELIGFPAEAGGLLVSGGNMANFVCFLAARTAKGDAEGAGRRTAIAGRRSFASTPRPKRTPGSRRPPICSASAPTRSAGSRPTISSGWTPLRSNDQIVADTTRGDLPFLVVGTAGSVSTGAVDPLSDIAAVCRRHDVWFHVDGAYGALAARGARRAGRAARRSARPIRSRSIRTSGCTRRSRPAARWCATRRSAGARSPTIRRYYHFDDEATNYFDYGPQNSRGFRALKVWLALRQVGRGGLPPDDRRRHALSRGDLPRARAAAPGVRGGRRSTSASRRSATCRATCGHARRRRTVEAYLRRAQSGAARRASSAAARRSCRTRWSTAASRCAPASSTSARRWRTSRRCRQCSPGSVRKRMARCGI